MNNLCMYKDRLPEKPIRPIVIIVFTKEPLYYKY